MVASQKDKGEHLPFGVLQALILSLEEVRDGVKEGLASSRLQIAHTQRLPLADRERMMPMIKGQREHWIAIDKAINWLILRVQQRMRWPAKIRQMTDEELNELGINPCIKGAMEWNHTEELQQT